VPVRRRNVSGFRRSRLALVSAGRDMSEAVERRKAYSKVLYGPFPQLCSSLYVYGAVAPLGGKHFFTEEAKLNTDGFRTFIDGLAERFEASFNVGPTSCFEADF
jgi:hypothetical protein